MNSLDDIIGYTLEVENSIRHHNLFDRLAATRLVSEIRQCQRIVSLALIQIGISAITPKNAHIWVDAERLFESGFQQAADNIADSIAYENSDIVNLHYAGLRNAFHARLVLDSLKELNDKLKTTTVRI